MRDNRVDSLFCIFIVSLVEYVALDNPKKKMLKRVWPYPLDFCIRFLNIPDNPT